MEKGVRLRGRAWLMQVVVTVGYALAYLAVRPLSDGHWALTSGLRLACLLLVPYRYWFALAVGEAVPLLYSLLPCLNQFGNATIAIWSFPPLVTAMPLVWLSRRYFGLFPAPRTIDMKVLLTCVLTVSLVWTGVTYVGLYLEAEPQRTVDQISPVMIAGLLVGNYVAILTVTTWPLLLKIGYNGSSWKRAAVNAIRSPLTSDAIFIALPLLAIISIISAYVPAPLDSMLEMSLFLPIAWLAVKYGWRGVAACGPIAVACVCVLTRPVPDVAVIQAQAFLAFAVTCLFIMGARIASQLHVAEREREAVSKTLRVAQQCVHQADLRLRSTSQSLEVVGGSMSVVQGRIVDRVKMFLPDADRQTLLRQAAMTQNHLYRMAENLHPSAWRDRGLPAALRETIGRALDEMGVVYTCDIQGRGLSQLAVAVHQSVYRLAVEGVTSISAKRRCQQIRLVLRGGQRVNGHRWVMLRITGSGDPLTFRAPMAGNGRTSIASLLGAMGLGVEGMKDHVALYSGTMHVKEADGAFVITMLMHDLPHMSVLGHAQQSRAARLWVH
ncbi:MASE1 domain-containing protein [Dyella sp.]|uniref:MASE1 domain-containing protein n=1 Tax=Dyella sp. TaxID=1869338 RepID=UPI002B45902B|nr:MASE1 domain-containing protein [Dyella sp.]HKT28818.1 MASE1 domain-containing protein [Dyella sp.]